MELDLLLLPLDELVDFFHRQYSPLSFWDRAWAIAFRRRDFRERVSGGEYVWYRATDAAAVVRGARKAGYRLRIRKDSVREVDYWVVTEVHKL